MDIARPTAITGAIQTAHSTQLTVKSAFASARPVMMMFGNAPVRIPVPA